MRGTLTRIDKTAGVAYIYVCRRPPLAKEKGAIRDMKREVSICRRAMILIPLNSLLLAFPLLPRACFQLAFEA